MRIAVLGAAGILGRRVSLDLAETQGVTEVLVADTNPRVASLEDVLPFEKGRAFVIDEPEALGRAVSDCDAVIGEEGASAETESELASVCISNGVPYLSPASHADNYEALMVLDEKARSQGTLVLSGAGWPASFTSVLAVAGARELDQVHEVRISWVVSSVGGAPDDALRRGMRSLGGHAPVFEDGSWTRKPAGGASEEVFFPEPVGWSTVQLVSAVEPLTLPRSIDGVSRVVAKGGIKESVVSRVAGRFASVGPLAQPTTRDRFLELARPFMPLMARIAGMSGGWSAARVDVRGIKNGANESVAFGVVDQFPNLHSGCLVTAAVMTSRGEIKGPGVITPDFEMEAGAFVAGLKQRGVGIARLHKA